MGCLGNHAISYNQNRFIFRTIFFSYKLSKVFNVGVITPWDTSLSNGPPHYAPNFEKVGGILVSACPYVCMYVRTYVFMFEISS